MEFSEEFKDKCNLGEHDLIVIDAAQHGWDGTSRVVKWCKLCGAVVIDLHMDNQIKPGYYMEMKYPQEIWKPKN